MMYCIASWPPSKNVRAYLVDHYQKVMLTDIITPKLAEMARTCNARLDRIALMGIRKQVPSALELEALKVGMLLSNSSLDCAWRVSELLNLFHARPLRRRTRLFP